MQLWLTWQKFILRISPGQGTSGWLDCQPHSAYHRFCNKLQDRNSILILPFLILQFWTQTQKYCIMYQLSSSSRPQAFSNSKFSGEAYVVLTGGTGHLRYTCISHGKTLSHTAAGSSVCSSPCTSMKHVLKTRKTETLPHHSWIIKDIKWLLWFHQTKYSSSQKSTHKPKNLTHFCVGTLKYVWHWLS